MKQKTYLLKASDYHPRPLYFAAEAGVTTLSSSVLLFKAVPFSIETSLKSTQIMVHGLFQEKGRIFKKSLINQAKPASGTA